MNYRNLTDGELERVAYGNQDPLVAELLRRWTVTATAIEAVQNELDLARASANDAYEELDQLKGNF